MKSFFTSKLIFFAPIISGIVFLVTCHAPLDPMTDYMNYEKSEGEIGSAGGIIKVTDPSSALYNISVKIPQGAISSETLITLSLASNSVKLPFDASAIMIQLEPKGLIFNKPIDITLPIKSGTDTTNLFCYYIDPDSAIVEQIPVSINSLNNTMSFETNHFSIYAFSDQSENTRASYDLYYVDKNGTSEDKVVANVWIEGAIKPVGWGFEGVTTPIDNMNVLDWINAEDKYPIVNFTISLRKRFLYFFNTPVGKEIKVHLERKEVFEYTIYGQNYSSDDMLYLPFNKEDPNQEEKIGYFGGKALCVYWKKSLDPNNKYFLKVEWDVDQNIQGAESSHIVDYTFCDRRKAINPSNMKTTDPDANNDGILDQESWIKPTVITRTPEEITETHAKLGGEVVDQGISYVTEKGICYNTIGNPNINDIKKPYSYGGGTGQYFWYESLSTNTKYYYRAYAINSQGPGYGEVISFTTLGYPPVVDFKASATTIIAGQSVQFTDQSTNNPTSWSWTFGDGETSTIQNPLHTYSTAGTYTIVLTATNNSGSNTATKTNYITVNSGGGDGTVTDIDGNVYNTIKISTQTWMQENLKTTKYTDGTSIPNVTVSSTWAGLTTGAYCDFNNDANNGIVYGHLYNFYTINGSKKVCPTGWHVSSDNEWKTLEMYLGMTQAQANLSYTERGTTEGGQLKEAGTSHWLGPNTGATNSSGFTALPGMYRNEIGSFATPMYGGGFWWTSTMNNSSSSFYHAVQYNVSTIWRFYHPLTSGFSLRCIKDN